MSLPSHFFDNNIPKITPKATNIEDYHLLGQNKKKKGRRKKERKLKIVTEMHYAKFFICESKEAAGWSANELVTD